MITVFIRTLILYLFLLLSIKFMGKRQVGELEISELVCALLISEIASAPIESSEVSLLSTLIPLLIIVSLEVVFSFLATKCEWIKSFLGGKPSFLINKGNIDEKELARSRLSVEELICQLRLKGAGKIDNVYYAILEQNGQISVIEKSVSAGSSSKKCKNKSGGEDGISHPVIIDGHIKNNELSNAGKDIKWLEGKLREMNVCASDIFLMSVDDSEHIFVVYKKEKI